jgi:hypothetical protein
MKRPLMVNVLFLILLFGISECPAETVGIVYLKNAESVRGAIVEILLPESLTLRAMDGTAYEFPFNVIDKIKIAEPSTPNQPEIIDIIHLRDGGTAGGHILEILPGRSIKMESDDGIRVEHPFDSVKKIEFEVPAKKQQEHRGPRKNPDLALILSGFLPGWGGQFYNGDFLKGIILGSITAAGSIAALAFMVQDLTADEDEEPNPMLLMGGLAGAAAWGYSMHDAYKSAKRLNEIRGYSLYQVYLKNGLALSFTPGLDTKNLEFEPGVKLTYRF